MILTTSASKVIRLLLALDFRAFPAAGIRTGQTTQEKQKVWINNKNKARTTLGGSFGSPSAFDSLPSLVQDPLLIYCAMASIRAQIAYSRLSKQKLAC
jgi:hypothetical protein